MHIPNLPENPTPAEILTAVQDLVAAQAAARKHKRAEQARINGAQSKGPTTPEGKAKSSRNSLKHGYAAKINILIDPDDSDEFDAHLAGYRDSYRPINYAEADLVDELASISWRKSRLIGIETALIDFQLSVQETKLDEYFPDEQGNPRLHLAFAWQSLARKPLPRELPADPGQPIDSTIPPEELDIQSIELVRRYLTTLDRQYRNALLNLRQYRKDFAPPAAHTPPAELPLPLTQPVLRNKPRPPIVPKPNEPTPAPLAPAKSPERAAGPPAKYASKVPEVAA